jgi:hypothetical protein
MTALVRASFWNLPVAEMAEHLAAARLSASTAIVPFVRSAAAATAVAVFKPRGFRSFRGYDDFSPVFTAAKFAAIAVGGPQWWADSALCRKARLPVAWVKWKGACSSGTCYRDVNMPVGRFWPGGEMPMGPEYAAPAAASQFGKAPPRAPVVIDAPAWEWIDAAD